MDISLVSEASIAAVGHPLALALNIARFRPNLMVEAFDSRPFPEDRWLKELIVFGDRPDAARLRVNRKTLRCMVINIDPETGQQNPAILKEVVKTRKNQVGVYATTERPGSVQVGDTIYLVK